MSEINVTLAANWKGFFEEEKRFRVAYGGRGSGKSISMAIMAVVKAMAKYTRFLCIRALQKSLKESSMQLIKDAIRILGVEDLFDCGETYIRHKKNGSEFLFSGIKYNSGAVKSTQGIDVAWIDEADSITKKQLTDLTPTIRNDDAEIWISFNPQLDDDYVYDRFVLNHSDIAIVREFNYPENPFFPKVLELERQDCLANYPDLHDHIWLGKTLDVSDACYYSKSLSTIKERGQIGAISWDSRYPVSTYWDIGYSDYTSIWSLQRVGTQMRIIDFEQSNGEHPAYYAQSLADRPYVYDTHYLPHDAKHQRFGMTQTISSQLQDAGLKGAISYTPKGRGISDIQATRLFISRCFFDEERTREGVKMLRNYKRRFDEKRNTYSDTPIHDWASHAADAFRYLAMDNVTHNDIVSDTPTPLLHNRNITVKSNVIQYI